MSSVSLRRALGSLALAYALAGCVRGPAVESALPLRRVVLYRSGVGYFERAGHVRRPEVEFRVRPDDVGDFLGTLAVLERGGSSVRYAAFPLPDEPTTGEPSAEPSAPRSPARRAVRLTLDGNEHDLVVGYMSETPVWRPTYRVVFTPAGAQLQAWGVVQNTSGEDWRSVRLSLVNGSPVSFRSQLAEPVIPERPLVSDRGQVLEAVPQAETQLATESAREADVNQTAGDRDGDAVPDALDACPDEPGAPSANAGRSGCPGQVQVTSAQVRISNVVRFEGGNAVVRSSQYPTLDAVAAALRSAPSLRLELAGHADATAGANAQRLSVARAEAVRAELVRRGIAASRLAVRGYGATRPLEDGTSPRARASANRVELRTLDDVGALLDDALAAPGRGRRARSAPAGGYAGAGRAANAPGLPPPPPPPRVQPMAPATITAPGAVPSMPRTPAALAAMTESGLSRFDLPHDVTVPDRSATMVLLVAREVPGEQTFLFAPDPHVAASQQHPFHVARFENTTGAQLERGPVAIFSSDSFLGQGLLEALPAGATTTIPFALERALRVERSASTAVEGARLVRVRREALTLERFAVTRTTLRVRSGRGEPSRVRVRVSTAPNATLVSPREGVEEVDGALLALVTVPPRETAERVLEHRAPFTLAAAWTDPVAQEAVEDFVRAGRGDDATRAALGSALALRRQLTEQQQQREQLVQQRAALEQGMTEVRANLDVVRRIATAADLRERLTRALAQQSAQVEQLTQRLVELDTRVGEAQVRFTEALRDLSYDSTAPTPGARPATP